MDPAPNLATPSPPPVTVQVAVSDIAIIIVLSVLVIGLVTFLHAVLPPIA